MTNRPLTICVVISVPNTKPYIQAACICEKILMEEHVASLIRVVDVFHLDLNQNPNPNQPQLVPFNMFICVKSGDLKGSFKLGLRLRRPRTKKVEETQFIPVELLGEGHGASIRITIGITNPEYGLHWYDLLWNEEVLTSMPIDLKPEKDNQTKAPQK